MCAGRELGRPGTEERRAFCVRPLEGWGHRASAEPRKALDAALAWEARGQGHGQAELGRADTWLVFSGHMAAAQARNGGEVLRTGRLEQQHGRRRGTRASGEAGTSEALLGVKGGRVGSGVKMP